MGATNAQWAKIPNFATSPKIVPSRIRTCNLRGSRGQTPSGAFVQVIKIPYFSYCATTAAAFEEKCITPTH